VRLSDLDARARANHGIITFERSGLSRSAWYRAIAAGAIDQVHPMVGRLPGTQDTPEQRIAAGVFAAGAPALASHRSAARLWGVPRPDTDPVDVILVGRRRDLALDGVVIHRTTDRNRLTPQRRSGIPCTNILRTIIDLGAVDPGGLHGAVGHAITTNLASLGALDAAVAELAGQGRRGVVALREAIADWSIDQKPADSVLEAVMARLIATRGLPPVEFHPIIEGHEVDFRVIGTPVILECDGWRYHGLDRTSFERDRDRDADLIAAGWIVVRFTYRAIVSRPAATAQRIRAAVERWAPRPDPADPTDDSFPNSSRNPGHIPR
jgi:very-short-patch-repair endonuclease